MKPWLLMVLAIAGGAIGAWATTIFLAGGLHGVLWIYVFGDDPWPAWVNPAFGVAILVIGIALWVLMAWAIWSRFRRA